LPAKAGGEINKAPADAGAFSRARFAVGGVAVMIVPRTRSSHGFTENAHANFGFKSGTTRIDLLVSLSIPKFVQARRKC
jgi:hypothetical protein